MQVRDGERQRLQRLCRVLSSIERALAGEEFVITRRCKPAVRLVPVGPDQPKRKSAALKGELTIPESFFDPLPDEIIDAFYESKIFPGSGVRLRGVDR